MDSSTFVEELSDVDRLRRIFRGYFADHETCSSIGHDDLQAMVDERAHACASKYREKLRRLHLSHTDYYLDTIRHLVDRVSIANISDDAPPVLPLTPITTQSSLMHYSHRQKCDHRVLSITVV